MQMHHGSHRNGQARLVPACALPQGSTDHSEALKAQVRKAVTGTRRGKSTTAEQRAQINSLLSKLEATNTIRDTAQHPLLQGWWALLYQGPLDEARAAQDKAGTLEGPFLAALQPLTRSGPLAVRTRANVQLLDIAGGRAENISEFSALNGGLKGSLRILGSAAVMQPQAQGAPVVRVSVTFDAFELSLGSLKWTVPLSSIKPTGWIETTYMDEELRVGRGDKGSIFVAVRIKDRYDTSAD